MNKQSAKVADVIEKRLKAVRDSGGNITDQVEVVNRIIDAASSDEMDDDADGLSVVDNAKQLLALFDKQNSIWAIDDGSKKSVTRPETSIAQSSLFTGAIHEPQMYTELKKEIVRFEATLENGMKEFKKILDEKEGVGRKLDFIAQEMNREANTILSKAGDLITSDVGIALKTEIEKIREQIQNVE